MGLDIPEIPADAPAGVLPGVRQHLYRTVGSGRRQVALFDENVRIPLQKFMGVMGVAPERDVFVGDTPTSPPPETGVQSSTQPGPYEATSTSATTVGSSLYLPVFQDGALFYTGDAHGVQG